MAYVYVIVQACEARNVVVLGEYREICYAGTSVLHGLDLVWEGLCVAEGEGVEEGEVDGVVCDAGYNAWKWALWVWVGVG